MLYLDTKVSSEQFQHGWSSYIAWTSVGLSIIAIIPVVYLIRLKPPTSDCVKIEEYTRENQTENEYILSSNKQQISLRSLKKHFQYVDIHDVE